MCNDFVHDWQETAWGDVNVIERGVNARLIRTSLHSTDPLGQYARD